MMLKEKINPSDFSPSDYHVFFMHIPKCAGTSLREQLQDAFLAENIYPNYGWDTFNINDNISNYSLVMGHYDCRIEYFLDPNFYRFTFLRDPMSRTISSILHAIREPSFIGRDLSNPISLEDLVNEPLLINLFANIQTAYLSAEINQDVSLLKKNKDFKFSSDQLFKKNISVDRAIEYAKTLDYVGFAENFENDSGDLFDRLQLHRPTFPKLANVADNKNILEEFGPDELTIIKKANDLDNELYIKLSEIKKNNPYKSYHFLEKNTSSLNNSDLHSELKNKNKKVSILMPPFKGSGFHALELTDGVPYRWSGPYKTSNIFIDLYPKRNTIHLKYNLYPSHAATKVTFYLDRDHAGESPTVTNPAGEEQEIFFLVPDSCNFRCELKFIVDQLSKPTKQDPRQLGFMIKSVDLLTPTEAAWRKFYNNYIRFPALKLLMLLTSNIFSLLHRIAR